MPVKKKKDSEQPRIAAAIRYDAARDDAPRLTAKGKGHVAERIIELARQHDIPVRSDKALIQILSQLDIDRHIPPELYKAVAEILAFVYSANEKYREEQSKGYRVSGLGSSKTQSKGDQKDVHYRQYFPDLPKIARSRSQLRFSQSPYPAVPQNHPS